MAIPLKSVISFGMVAIPIDLFTVVQDNDIHFNQLYKGDHSRIRYKKTCAHCGDEITAKDIVRGYEYDKGNYVVVTDEELEKIKTEKEKTIEILSFVKLDEISPVYYEKSYQAVPQAGSEKAFELLRAALMDEGKIAIGKSVLGTKETLMALIPREEGIIVITMYYADEMNQFQRKYVIAKVSKQELEMAKILINALAAPFKPEQYTDEYQRKLHELIENKIAGHEVVASVQEEQDTGKIINLMDALKASVEKAKKDKESA